MSVAEIHIFRVCGLDKFRFIVAAKNRAALFTVAA